MIDPTKTMVTKPHIYHAGGNPCYIVHTAVRGSYEDPCNVTS